MAQRKIVWSNKARIKLFKILDFYNERNQSRVYSEKLFHKFSRQLKLLVKDSDLGIKTDIENVKGLIVDEFILFYEITKESIIVHTVWDCRQNPDDLVIK